MKITIRRSEERGHASLGWLNSRFTFSFADYHDPKHMHFRTLRVINEDHIAPGGGFPMHPHKDMEIFSYVLEGALEHKDSLGNGRVLRPGQIQLMSTGAGVLHSEFNPSADETTHMLQVWLFAEKRGLQPGYTEWHPKPEHENEPKVLVISPDGRDDSAVIHQDADIYRVKLKAGEQTSHEIRTGRGAWVQMARGSISLNGTSLGQGDAGSSVDPGVLTLTAVDDAELLLFDLG